MKWKKVGQLQILKQKGFQKAQAEGQDPLKGFGAGPQNYKINIASP